MKTKTFLSLLILMLVALPVIASPPSKVELNWDAATKTLTVKASHYSINPKSHFIKSVKVVVDGKEAAVREFTAQENAQGQTVKVPLPDTKPGQAVTVTAICNLFGSGEGKLVIPQP